MDMYDLGLHNIGNIGTSPLIKSIQRGNVEVVANSSCVASTSVSITSVDLTKSIILVKSVGINTQIFLDEGYFNSATQITLNCLCNQPTSGRAEIDWQVIEFVNVKSLQSGTCSTTNGYGTTLVTISAINLSKSILIISGAGKASNCFIYSCNGYLSSATQISIRWHTSGISNIYWRAIEFD